MARICPGHTVRRGRFGTLSDEGVQFAVRTAAAGVDRFLVNARTGPTTVLCITAATAARHAERGAFVKHACPSNAAGDRRGYSP